MQEIEPEEGWRDRAINEALRAQGGEGVYPPHSVLARIRERCPDQQTMMLFVDRVQLVPFLQERATQFRSLLSGGDNYFQRGEVSAYLGWYEVTWEGETLELALTPGMRGTSLVIGIARNEAILTRLARLLEDHAIRPLKRCLAYSRMWENAPELDAEIGKVTWDDVILAPNILAGVRDAVEGFLRHKEAFTTLGFPWKRGLLLVGPAGTGKTMLCKAAASALPELPFLYVRDFQADPRFNQNAVQTIFERARKLAPCLLAFEDIDGLVTAGNRTVFLNELDGFQENSGLLIIAPSNHPERIDEALLKRPSRFDRVFHIGLPAPAERQAYCLRLLSRSGLSAQLDSSLNVEELSRRVAERSDGFTPAYLKEVFVSAALRQAQEGLHTLDARFAEAVMGQVEELREQLRRVQRPETLGDFVSPDAAPVGIRRSRE